MTTYVIKMPRPEVMLPESATTTEFDGSTYTTESMYLVHEGGELDPIVIWTTWEAYLNYNSSPVATLIKWACQSLEWSPETGMTMIVPSEYLRLDDSGEEFWFDTSIPIQDQGSTPGDVQLHFWLAAMAGAGFEVSVL